MASDALKQAQAKQSRRLFIDRLINGLPGFVAQLESGVRRLADQVALPAVMLRRREALDGLRVASGLWLESMLSVAKAAYPDGLMPASTPAALAPTGRLKFSLVDDETIEAEILSSRLSLSIKEKAGWEFGDLRSRMIFLDGCEEIESNEILRPEVLAHLAVKSWRAAGLGHDVWRTAQSVLHEEFSLVVCEAYHEVNRQLIQQGVLPEIDLRPFIRRAYDPVSGVPQAASLSPPMGGTASMPHSGFQTDTRGNAFADSRPMSGVGGTFHEDADHAEAVLARLNRLMGRAPEGLLRPVQPLEASPNLGSAISAVQKDVAEHLACADPAADSMNPQGLSAMLAGLRQHRQTLKAAATTSDERATIEVVALLFQSILTEDRIPSAVRVWFARLQMPVLRVAIAEPDFFATSDHPAKRLIDSMGACVMGFDAKNMQLTGAAIEQSIGLEISHESFGGDDDGAAGQADSATSANPAPEHLVHGIKIAGLEEKHHAHEFLQGDRGTRHTHTVRGEQHTGGVAGDKAVLFGESDDLRARVEFTPPLREFLDAPTGSGHDDRFDTAQFSQHRIGGRHPEVVVDVLMAAVHHTIEKRVIDVLGLQLRPPRFRMTRRNLRVT